MSVSQEDEDPRSEARGADPLRREPPHSVEEALSRARRHGRAAMAEALAAARALLDAASLATTGQPSEARRFLGLAARGLEDLERAFAGDGAGPPVLAAVAEALDAEIARWEVRAREDEDARAVLRAYLGLREILWELGVRRAARPERPQGAADSRRGAAARRSATPRGPRIERVPVEG